MSTSQDDSDKKIIHLISDNFCFPSQHLKRYNPPPPFRPIQLYPLLFPISYDYTDPPPNISTCIISRKRCLLSQFRALCTDNDKNNRTMTAQWQSFKCYRENTYFLFGTSTLLICAYLTDLLHNVEAFGYLKSNFRQKISSETQKDAE